MSKSKGFHYKFKDFNAGELSSAISNAISAAHLEIQNLKFSISVDLSDNSRETKKISFEDIWSIVNLRKTSLWCRDEDISFSFSLIAVGFDFEGSEKLILTIDSERGKQITDFSNQFHLALNLEEHVEDKPKDISQSIRDAGVSLIDKKNKSKSLNIPEKITLKWLHENVPFTFWLYLIGAFTGIFIFGTIVGQTSIVREFLNNTGKWLSQDNKQTIPK